MCMNHKYLIKGIPLLVAVSHHEVKTLLKIMDQT